MKKVLTVIGARPQFIKASAVSHAIKQANKFDEVVVHTGQHFDENMSSVFFSELGMDPPKYTLDIHGGNHGEMTGRMLTEIEKVILTEKPDAVLVYGDTNSTLAGALAAVKLHVPVAHVEAGLRSFNMRMPEEINRILTDRVSTWLFTPTRIAEENLIKEGIEKKRIFPVGDVMYDVALYHGERAKRGSSVLNRLNLLPQGYVLATIHRAENTDDNVRLRIIAEALIATTRILPVILPVHPRTRQAIQRCKLLESLKLAATLIEPVGYLDMVQLEKNAALVVTDSGGVQKEAFFHKVPCVTVRDETEWVELIEAGWNRLAPPVHAHNLAEIIKNALGRRGSDVNPYGDGVAAILIAQILLAVK